jgi:hypothetical protein
MSDVSGICSTSTLWRLFVFPMINIEVCQNNDNQFLEDGIANNTKNYHSLTHGAVPS